MEVVTAGRLHIRIEKEGKISLAFCCKERALSFLNITREDTQPKHRIKSAFWQLDPFLRPTKLHIFGEPCPNS